MRKSMACAALLALLPLCACKTVDSAADGVASVGSTVAHGVSQVPSLVNVNLSNVLNDLSLDLKIDKANIPINAQIPINIAANVCGVSISVISIGAGNGKSGGCTANSISPELKQYIQEQLAANGSVGGGAQTNAPAAPAGTSQPATGTTVTNPPATGTAPTAPSAGATITAVPPGSATTQPVEPPATKPQA